MFVIEKIAHFMHIFVGILWGL